MSDDVAEDWPELPHESSLSFPGPFEHHEVVVAGRSVPFLQADPVDGGQIDLTLDRRFGLMLTVEEAERFVPFLAHAIAVALGYTAHPVVDHGVRVRPDRLDHAAGRPAVVRPDPCGFPG
jgi:hypothetical protein